MSGLSRKTVAVAAGAALAVGAVTAGIVLAVQDGSGRTGAAPKERRPAIAKPLRLVSITPSRGSKDVSGTRDISVTYNQPLPATVPLPTLSPAIAGSWQRTGNTVVFTPDTGFPAGTRVTVTVAGTAGSTSRLGSSSYRTGQYSTARLQELLAQLGYLPLTWTPVASSHGFGEVSSRESAAIGLGGSAADQLSAAYTPPPGTFEWHDGYPARLRSFWSQGKPNTLDRGAVTGFEADHNLPTDGVAGPKVWKVLLAAAVKGERNTHGYSYAIVSKGSPESLTIWHNGAKVFSSSANTGISVAPTVNGTFPVYEKLRYQIMRGTNPDGSHYADPVSWVSYFNGGDAVHYFPRSSFGFPQSLGCVELPYSAAKRAYPFLPYGTLVTVE